MSLRLGHRAPSGPVIATASARSVRRRALRHNLSPAAFFGFDEETGALRRGILLSRSTLERTANVSSLSEFTGRMPDRHRFTSSRARHSFCRIRLMNSD
jgi:hypothetical protein